MSQKINTTTIGLFIVTGVVLGVSGLLLFSSAKLFSPTRECIVYFDDSLNGLNEGAPVKYRGVTIGKVKQVMVRYNQAISDFSMPVILELEKKLIEKRLREPAEVFTEQALQQRIKIGLRASLQSESLVTGVLYVDIRINPNAPPPVFHEMRNHLPEIPTEPTQIQQLMSNLASLDIKSIEKNLNTVLTNLNTAITGLRMTDINAGITNVLLSVDRLVSSPMITNDLAALQTTLDQYRLLGANLNNRIGPLADSVTNSLAAADDALGQIRGAAENLRIFLAPDAPVPTDLTQTLQQLSGAVHALSELLDFLKQHPNALITGRQILPKKP